MLKVFFKVTVAIVMNILEMLASFLWLMLPLGFHVFMLQMRTKVDTLPAINGYFDANSTWSMVYKGVVLVNTTPGSLGKKWDNVVKFFKRTRYNWLTAAVLLVIGLLAYIAYKLV